MAEIAWTRGQGGPIEEAVHAMESRVPRMVYPVTGVSLGGCVDAVGTDRRGAFRHMAHAHTEAKSEHRGWICVLSSKPERLVTATGKPTRLFWHEWAHIATGQGHTEKFRETLRKVGQPSAIMKGRSDSPTTSTV